MLAAATAIAVASSQPLGDPVKGQQLYERKCGGCHSPDMNRIGPRHIGVFGRKAGSLADYSYSAALKKSDLIWDAATLDKWLQGPPKLVPGTKMGFSLADAKERQDVIGYVATLK